MKPGVHKELISTTRLGQSRTASCRATASLSAFINQLLLLLSPSGHQETLQRIHTDHNMRSAPLSSRSESPTSDWLLGNLQNVNWDAFILAVDRKRIPGSGLRVDGTYRSSRRSRMFWSGSGGTFGYQRTRRSGRFPGQRRHKRTVAAELGSAGLRSEGGPSRTSGPGPTLPSETEKGTRQRLRRMRRRRLLRERLVWSVDGSGGGILHSGPKHLHVPILGVRGE